MTDDGADGRPGQKRTCPACGAFRQPPLPGRLTAALRLTRTLTPREHSVFRLLGYGHDNRSIAHELGISERTVKRHITAILTKLELRSRLQVGLSALIVSSSPDAYWPKGLMDQARFASDDVAAHSQEAIMTFDALSALRQAGNPVDQLTAVQRDVLAELTEEEVAILNSVKRRLDAVSDVEVEGHSANIKIL
jgi:DNA-binding CsgD family transcriptional regulator